MDSEPQEVSDDELLKLLDDRNGVWVVITGDLLPRSMPSPATLREALKQARGQPNEPVAAVLKICRLGSNGICIRNEQIHRLWKHLDLV